MLDVKKSLALLLGLGLGSYAQATVISLPEPGYLVIDGVYYGYGLREPGSTNSEALLNSLGADGFHFDTAIDLGSCARSDASPISTPALGSAQFRAADSSSPPEQSGLAFASPILGSEPEVRLIACQQATFVLVDTSDADVGCSNSISLPIARGDCPGLDAADPGFVFFNTFE